MSYKRVETLGDAIRHCMLLEIICKGDGCSRVRRIAPVDLLGRGRFSAGATLAAIGARMRCRGKDFEGGGCGHRGAIVRPVFEPSRPDDEPPGGGGAVVRFPVERRGSAMPVEQEGGSRRRRARR